jgi:predicted phosphodiesterase
MRRALISDIHGNLEALEAVLCDIARQRIDEIFCLGDLVGYGPNPCECVDRVMERCRVTLMGNHDDPSGWKGGWTSWQFKSGSNRVRNGRRLAFLSHLPHSYEFGRYLFVHGSPRRPLNEYVFPEDIYNRRKMTSQFSLVKHYCFQGHTHVPGIFNESFEFFTPEEIDRRFMLGTAKLIANVGSVGQPRDGDNRACYMILDDGLDEAVGTDSPIERVPDSSPYMTYRRIPFDFETTIRKINEIRPKE